MLRNTETRYGLVSKLLHWLIAIGIIGLIALGWWMVGLSYYHPWYNRSLELHRALGLAVIGLAALFILWKGASPSPRLQDELKPSERIAARVVHAILLLLMLAIPVSGYLISTSAGAGIPFFGLFEIPALVPVSEATRELAVAVHYYLAYGSILFIAAHAGGALKHQFIDRHGTVRRML